MSLENIEGSSSAERPEIQISETKEESLTQELKREAFETKDNQQEPVTAYNFQEEEAKELESNEISQNKFDDILF